MLSRHIGYQIDLGYNIKRGMPGAFQGSSRADSGAPGATTATLTALRWGRPGGLV